jgi:hypothetical protein
MNSETTDVDATEDLVPESDDAIAHLVPEPGVGKLASKDLETVSDIRTKDIGTQVETPIEAKVKPD